jgi:hypothetical protein
METRKKNWKPEQEKIVRAFAKAFGIVHIYEIGEKVFADAVKNNEMKFSGTINSKTYVNAEGTGLIGKPLCDEYCDARGSLYWYVFNPDPLADDVYLVFETRKPRSVDVLRSTYETYEMLLEAIEVDIDRLDEFWKIETEEETPWDAMHVRLWKWLHREGVC